MREKLRSTIQGKAKGAVKASWYQGGYLANIVDYAMAVLAWQATEKWKGVKWFNLQEIWNLQDLPKPLLRQLLKIAEKVQDVITAEDRGQANVTQWCKRDGCWQAVKTAFGDFDALGPLEEEFRSSAEDFKESSKKERQNSKYDRENNLLTQVVSYKCWTAAWAFEEKHHVLESPMQERALRSTLKIPLGKLPPSRSCQLALQALEKLRDEGFDG